MTNNSLMMWHDANGSSQALPGCDCPLNEPVGAEHQHFNLWLIVRLLPVLALLGMAGNALNVLVYSRPHMRRCSLNVYLAALAISDAALCLSAIFMFTLEAVRAHNQLAANVYIATIK